VLAPTIIGLTGFFALLCQEAGQPVSLSGSGISNFSVVALVSAFGTPLSAANLALTGYLSAQALGVCLLMLWNLAPSGRWPSVGLHDRSPSRVDVGHKFMKLRIAVGVVAFGASEIRQGVLAARVDLRRKLREKLLVDPPPEKRRVKPGWVDAYDDSLEVYEFQSVFGIFGHYRPGRAKKFAPDVPRQFPSFHTVWTRRGGSSINSPIRLTLSL
jgi:hypothetical protein